MKASMEASIASMEASTTFTEASIASMEAFMEATGEARDTRQLSFGKGFPENIVRNSTQGTR